MTEPAVVDRVRQFLTASPFPNGASVLNLLTDAHHTLLHHKGLGPYQRISVPINSTVLHPDLTGQLDDGESLLAVEAKGEGDLLKGVMQAEQYQQGVHYSFLAAPKASVSDLVTSTTRRKNIGLLLVGAEVQVVHWPRPRQPWQRAYRSVWRQLDSGVRARAWSTFTYNLPTHYLAWALALSLGREYDLGSLSDVIAPYHRMPKRWKAALRGAEKLGIVHVGGETVRLTDTGGAVRDIIDRPLASWNEVHANALRSTLADALPRAGAALRLLLLREPMIRLVLRGLKRLDASASMAELAPACDALDHDRAPLLFLTPERSGDVTDSNGQVLWTQTEGHHFRSTTFYQMKRILQHAGLLEDTGTEASSAKDYHPSQDWWRLREGPVYGEH